MRIPGGFFLDIVTNSCFSQELPIKPARTISFTTDEGSYMNVDLSPDGRTVVFDLLGDLYTVPSTGGNTTQLTRGLALHLRPVWSPDGRDIAYLSDISGSFHLNIMDAAGTWHKTLGSADRPLYYGADATWTPDSHFVVVGDSVYGVTGGKHLPTAAVQHLVHYPRTSNIPISWILTGCFVMTWPQ